MRANNELKVGYKSEDRFDGWSDEELAQTARDGCMEARNLLFVRNRTLMKRLGGPARRMVSIAAWAGRVNLPIEQEDVDQQAFVVFCELLVVWQPEREPFMTCLKRRLPWRLRHYVHITLAGRSGDQWLRTIPVGDASEWLLCNPCLTSEESEDELAWENYIKTLPQSLRPTVTLRYYDDLSSAQIAALTGRTRREINRKLRSAVTILRDGIREEWEGV